MDNGKKVYRQSSYGDTIAFAESLGWVDPFDDFEGDEWTPEVADACEELAIEFIESQGYMVISGDDSEE